MLSAKPMRVTVTVMFSGRVSQRAALHRLGLVPAEVHVEMPGGAADVVVGSPARLLGPAVYVADIDIDIDAAPAPDSQTAEEVAHGA